jgi:hypothetical protein
MREEFGFSRTECSCRRCSVFCETLPGSLVPSDLNRLIPQGADPFLWAEEHLRASPGFQVRTPFGVVGIPTLVPRKQANGHCHWLQDGLCSVHENAPFGCAFLSQCSQSNAHAEKIASAGRQARAKAFQDGDLYAQIWMHLWKKGLRYETGQEDRRRAMLTVKQIHRNAERRSHRKARKAERRRKRR